MIKNSSLLDYSYPGLCPNVYMQDGTLNPAIRDFVFKLLNSFYNSYGFKNPEAWVLDVSNIGSLTTNKYIRQSDFDCHVLVDINKFIETNMPKASVEKGLEALDSARKEWDRAKILLPFGEHALELFFEDPNLNPSSTDNCGRYSLMTDTWLKEPIFFAQDLDWEEKKKQVIEEAKEMAGELDKSFGQIRRDIQSIDELKEVMQAWPKETRQLYLNKIQKKLDSIEDEIENTITIKEDIVNERHGQHDLLSDTEIKFKYLGRYFYFAIINELKAIIGEDGVTVEELPLIEKVISEASLSKESLDRGNSAWIAPDGTVFSLRDEKVATHADWLDKNYNWLHKKYGFTIDNSQGDYDDYDPASFCGMLVAEGWSRVGDIENINGTGVEVPDLHNIPNAVFDFILSNLNNPKEKITLEDSYGNYITLNQEELVGGQKAVNKELSNKRLSTASKKDLPDEIKTLAIDMDDTIAHENPDHTIGELESGVKEALTRLKNDGWVLDIYSHRANTEQGADEIKEYLDKNKIPYDSILRVEKPLATYYIDNRGIHFTNWPDVLKQVEKSEKKASLYIISSLGTKYWIDPSGKEYTVGTALGHYGWVSKNILKEPLNAGDEQRMATLADKTEEMIGEGWTRITTEGSSQFSVEVNDLENLPSYLDNFIAQHFNIQEAEKGIGIELDDQNGKYVVIVNPFPNIQDAVNKKLNSKMSIAKLFSKKEALDLSDPALKEGPVYAVYAFEQPDFQGGSFSMYHIFGNHPRFGSTVSKNTLEELNIPIKQIKEAKIESPYDYSSTQFNLPKELSEKIIRWAIESIPEDQLFYDEDPTTHGIQLESHITLKYGLLTDDFTEIEKTLKGEKAPKIKFGKTSFFEPEGKDYDVVIIQVESEDLERLNKKLCDNVKHEDLQGNEYHPHVTVAYITKGSGVKYEGIDILNGEAITLDILTFSPKIGDKQSLELGKNKKKASGNNFLPSLVQAPNNEWQFQSGGSDLEIGVDPDPISDESTWYAPCTEGKPRNPEVWRQFISIFNDFNEKQSSLPSVEQYKKEHIQPLGFSELMEFRNVAPQDVQDEVDSLIENNKLKNAWVLIEHYLGRRHLNPHFNFKQAGEAEEWDSHYGNIWHVGDKVKDKVTGKIGLIKEINGDSVLVDEWKTTVNDIVQVDQSTFDFPKNTTWLNTTYQDQEPSKPLPVTYSPEINEDNLDQNSPGGFPRRYMGKPKGEYSSTSGEAVDTLIQMLKNKESILQSLTREITAITKQYALYVGNVKYPAARTLTYQKAEKILKEKFPEDYKNGTYMIAEEKFNTKEASSHGYGGWVSPDGKIILADDHGNAILKDPKAFGINEQIDKDHVRWQPLFENLYNEGWLRFRIWGNDLHFFGSTIDSVKKAEDIIFNELNSVTEISLDLNDANYVATTEEFKEKGFDAFRRISTLDKQPVMAKQAVLDFDNQYPIAGGSVDGRTVIDGVPNQSSIGAGLSYYTILKGIREVPFSAFTQMPALSYYSADEEKRTKELAEQIKQTGEITPLIVAVDNQGPYILEGGHRFDALRELGANSFPAMVVLDNESLNREAAINSLTREIMAGYSHAYWLDPNGKTYPVRGADEDAVRRSLDLSNEDTHSAWILRNLDMLKKDYGIDPKSLSGTSRSLVELGWTRIGDAYGTDWGIDVRDTDNIPSFVDDAIAKFAPEGAKITVAGPGSSRYAHSQSGYTFEWPVKSIQQTVNRIKQRGQYYQDKPVMAKQAGSYSSTYTDEQGEQFFNEQHQNDVDQVPYTNFDQRGIDFGFHDSPENTDSGIGWAKDNQPYVVRLDILYPGPDRPFPFGMPDYETILYPWTYSAGDGVEATNPD